MGEGSEEIILRAHRGLGPDLVRFRGQPRRFGSFKKSAGGDIMEADKNFRGLAAEVFQDAGVEQHGAAANLLEVVGDLKVIKETVVPDDVLQELAQPGDIPFAVAHLVNQTAFGFRLRKLEGLRERFASRDHAQIGAQHQHRIARRADDRLGVIARLSDFALRLFEIGDIDQHQHRAVDLVLERQVRTHAQGIRAPPFVAHLVLPFARAVDHFGHEALEVGQIEIMPHVAEGPPDVAGEEVELFFRLRSETTDGQVAPEEHDREMGGGLEIEQVAVETVQLSVAIGHLLVHGRQLFVGRLKLFLRGLQLFVGALQFFVGGSDFFVRGLELFMRRFLLLLQGLQIIACLGQVALELGDAARFVFGRARLRRTATFLGGRFSRLDGVSPYRCDGTVLKENQIAAFF